MNKSNARDININEPQNQKLLINILRKEEKTDMECFYLYRAFNSIQFFQQLKEELERDEIYYLFKELGVEKYQKHHLIYEQGDSAQSLYIVLYGQIQLFKLQQAFSQVGDQDGLLAQINQAEQIAKLSEKLQNNNNQDLFQVINERQDIIDQFRAEQQDDLDQKAREFSMKKAKEKEEQELLKKEKEDLQQHQMQMLENYRQARINEIRQQSKRNIFERQSGDHHPLAQPSAGQGTLSPKKSKLTNEQQKNENKVEAVEGGLIMNRYKWKQSAQKQDQKQKLESKIKKQPIVPISAFMPNSSKMSFGMSDIDNISDIQFTLHEGNNKHFDEDVDNIQTDQFIKKYFQDSLQTVALGSGESFGDFALKYKLPRETSAVSIQQSWLVTINRRIFQDVLLKIFRNRFSKKVNFLQTLPIFNGFMDIELEQIFMHIKQETHYKDYIIYKDNEPADKVYIIKQGEVQILQQIENPQTNYPLLNLSPRVKFLRMALMGVGQLFGNQQVLKNINREASAVCISTSVILWAFSKEVAELKINPANKPYIKSFFQKTAQLLMSNPIIKERLTFHREKQSRWRHKRFALMKQVEQRNMDVIEKVNKRPENDKIELENYQKPSETSIQSQKSPNMANSRKNSIKSLFQNEINDLNFSRTQQPSQAFQNFQHRRSQLIENQEVEQQQSENQLYQTNAGRHKYESRFPSITGKARLKTDISVSEIDNSDISGMGRQSQDRFNETRVSIGQRSGNFNFITETRHNSPNASKYDFYRKNMHLIKTLEGSKVIRDRIHSEYGEIEEFNHLLNSPSQAIENSIHKSSKVQQFQRAFKHLKKLHHLENPKKFQNLDIFEQLYQNEFNSPAQLRKYSTNFRATVFEPQKKKQSISFNHRTEESEPKSPNNEIQVQLAQFFNEMNQLLQNQTLFGEYQKPQDIHNLTPSNIQSPSFDLAKGEQSDEEKEKRQKAHATSKQQKKEEENFYKKPVKDILAQQRNLKQTRLNTMMNILANENQLEKIKGFMEKQ